MKKVSIIDIEREISLKTGLPAKDVSILYKSFLETVFDFIESGKAVPLRGIGVLRPKLREGGKVVQHPRTKEPKVQKDKLIVNFTASRVMLNRLNNES